jgi:hypothetical protein
MPRSARNTSLETRTARLRLKIRRAPHFVKIAKGLRLGYYRGAGCGTWIGRRYRGAGVYDTIALGVADDTADADSIKVLDYWQAQGEARRWAERQRLIDEGMVRAGPTPSRMPSRTISTKPARRRSPTPSVTPKIPSTPSCCRSWAGCCSRNSPPIA